MAPASVEVEKASVNGDANRMTDMAKNEAVFVNRETEPGASPRTLIQDVHSLPGVVPIEQKESIAAPASLSQDQGPTSLADGQQTGRWKGPDAGNGSVTDSNGQKSDRGAWKGPDAASVTDSNGQKSERRAWKGPDAASEKHIKQASDMDEADSLFSGVVQPPVEGYDSDNESLNEIKARTMYRMVEEIIVGGTKYKLLFLTNRQAQLLSTLEGSIRRVFDAFEIKTPKLIMNLIASQGVPKEYAGFGEMPTGPYANREEMYRNDELLVEFMRRVVVPMAIETNAIVLVEACGWCRLAVAFGKAVKEQRAQWPGGQTPFTTLGFTGDINFMYTNPDTDAFWKKLRIKSKAWKARDEFIKLVSYVRFALCNRIK